MKIEEGYNIPFFHFHKGGIRVCKGYVKGVGGYIKGV